MIDYQNMTVAELRAIAKEKGLTGYSKLKKQELVNLITINHCVEEEVPFVVDTSNSISQESLEDLKNEVQGIVDDCYPANWDKMNRHQKRQWMKIKRCGGKPRKINHYGV